MSDTFKKPQEPPGAKLNHLIPHNPVKSCQSLSLDAIPSDRPILTNSKPRPIMQLEDYFVFLSPDDIRLKGHRIGIDNILFYFLEGYSPEEILFIYPDLNLEKIYATITYYLQNRKEVDAYLNRIKNWKENRYQESLKYPSSQREKMRVIKQQRQDLLKA